MSINVIFCLWNSDVVEKVKENILLWSKGKMGCAALGNLCVRREIKEKLTNLICMDSLWEQPLY